LTIVACIALLVWAGLATARHGFWRMRERDDRDVPPAPQHWPAVAAIVPARDEARVIAQSIGSLLAQDYPGDLRIVLVDDNSSDGTAAIAAALPITLPITLPVTLPETLPEPPGRARPTIITGAALPPGWTGKLWAVAQGIDAVAASGATPKYLLLTDADITHRADTLRSLVARAEAGRLVLVSLMAHLRCESLAERATIPAFVFFFQMLYPFARVNRPDGPGAAAGGCMLADRVALAQSGGIAALRGALIDDCTLGAQLKTAGPIWLGLTARARSIRACTGFGDIAAMVARSAYAQLGYNPLLLAGTVAGMALLYLAPPALAIGGSGLAQAAGIAAWALMALLFQPVLRFYGRSPLWGLALPAIAAFYTGCTLLSAWQHGRGRGGMWKGRAQAAVQR
jgi:hopene-associated glycosyltransferase HpnB